MLNMNQTLKKMDVHLFDLKDKLTKLSKKNLSLSMLTSIDIIQELVKTKNQLALKYENIKLTILGKYKACDRPKHEHEVNKLKNDLSLDNKNLER